MLFSLKLQRDNRKNASAVDPAKGKTGKKAVFSSHCGDETTINYNRAFLKRWTSHGWMRPLPCICVVQDTQCRKLPTNCIDTPRPHGQNRDERIDYGRRVVWYAFGTAGDIDITNINPTQEQIQKFNREAEDMEQERINRQNGPFSGCDDTPVCHLPLPGKSSLGKRWAYAVLSGSPPQARQQINDAGCCLTSTPVCRRRKKW